MRQAAHAQEVARLKAQNDSLAQMLLAERETSTRLKDDMITQFTQMINGYSTGQSDRLQSIVGQVQTVNSEAVRTANKAMERYETEAGESSGRADQYLKDLDDIRQSNANHREDAKKVCRVGVSCNVPAAHPSCSGRFDCYQRTRLVIEERR